MAAPPPGPAHRGRLSAAGTARAVAAGELSAEAAVDGALRRLAEHADLCAFTSVRAAAARAEARALDARLARGEPAPRWAGVPFAVKGAGDAAEVAALRAAGAVPVGRTAVPPPGGHQTWGRTDRGPTRNPHRPDLSPGGSSAGSAAAVAAGIVPVATGSDGAGSTRIPAAWCGITGAKPTTALVRRRLGPGRDRSGLAVPGPLVADPADLAGWAELVLGPLPAAPAPRTAVWSADLGFAAAEVAAEVVAVARAAALRLGVPLVDVPVRLRDPAAAWAAVRGGDPRPRGLNDAALAAVFARADLLLTPTTPGPPHGHDGPGERMNVALTWAFNLSGHPAVSVPAGWTASGAPVGLQVVGRLHSDVAVLEIADAARYSVTSTEISGRVHGANRD